MRRRGVDTQMLSIRGIPLDWEVPVSCDFKLFCDSRLMFMIYSVASVGQPGNSDCEKY